MQQRTRTIDLDRRAIDPDARTIKATLSTEQPVDRFGESEVLEHSTKAINFERASSGLPLLFAHDQRQPVGVAENIRLEGRELKATLRFSRSAKGDEVWRDVADGVLRHLSIGYRIDATENTPNGYRATRWTPMEASVVSVPADHHAQIGRSFTMDSERDTDTLTLTRSQRRAAREAEIEHQAEAEREERAAVRAAKQERERIRMIRAAVNGLDIDDATVEEMIESGEPITAFRSQIIEALKRRETPLNPRIDVPNTLAHRDRSSIWGSSRDVTDHTSIRAAMVDGLALRSGAAIKEPSRDARQFAGLSLLDLAIRCLGNRGTAVQTRNPSEILSRALTSSDFPLLLSGLANKILQSMREMDPATHQAWVKFGTTPDFKANSRPALSSAPSLALKAEGAEITYGSLAERGESFSAKRYARALRITREAMVNDDLRAFEIASRGFAQAALRLEADLAYAQLTSNPTMADSVALFHANHGNLLTGGTTAFDATNALTALGAARAAMRKQKDPANNGYLDVRPAFLLLPVAKETLAESIITSLSRIDGSNAGVNNPGWIRNLTIVCDPRLDASSSAYWYLAANHQQVDTVEIAHLEGTNRGFTTVEEVNFATDDLDVKATWEGGCAVIDWAGLLRSNGA